MIEKWSSESISTFGRRLWSPFRCKFCWALGYFFPSCYCQLAYERKKNKTQFQWLLVFSTLLANITVFWTRSKVKVIVRFDVTHNKTATTNSAFILLLGKQLILVAGQVNISPLQVTFNARIQNWLILAIVHRKHWQCYKLICSIKQLSSMVFSYCRLNSGAKKLDIVRHFVSVAYSRFKINKIPSFLERGESLERKSVFCLPTVLRDRKVK